MSLKCLVSSTAAMAIPASGNTSAPDFFRRAVRRCAPRPSISNTPRLYVSGDLCRISAEQAARPSIRAAAMKTASPLRAHSRMADQFMGSITGRNKIVGLFAVGRRLTIHANAESRPLAATPPIDAASSLLQDRNTRRQLVAPRLQCGNLGSRRQHPAHNCHWNTGTGDGDHKAPETKAHRGAAADPPQGLGRALALRPQHLQLLDQRAPYFVSHDGVEIPGVCMQLFQLTLRQLLMSLHTLHEETQLHGGVIDGMNAAIHPSRTHFAGHPPNHPPPLSA